MVILIEVEHPYRKRVFLFWDNLLKVKHLAEIYNKRLGEIEWMFK